MKVLLALLTVLFFNLIFLPGRGGGALGVLLFETPVMAIVVGIPLACVAGSCLGKQTGFMRRLCLIGLVMLLFFWLFLLHISDYHGDTFISSLPFLGSSITLVLMRVFEDPGKEAAAQAAEVLRVEERRAQLQSMRAKAPEKKS